MNPFNFDAWAQPVISKPWAVIAVVLYSIEKRIGYRLRLRSHRAWQKATGTPR